MITQAERDAAQMVHFMGWMKDANDKQLAAVGFNPEAVHAVMSNATNGGAPRMDGSGGSTPPSTPATNPNYTTAGFSITVQEGIRRWFNQMEEFKAFSTTYSKEYLVPGRGRTQARLNVPVYDSTGSAEIDNYDDWNNRTDGGGGDTIEVVLHKVDDVITLYADQIKQGFDLNEMVASCLSRVKNKAWEYVLSKFAPGTAQADDSTKTISGIVLPATTKFSFEYAQYNLTEAIQPEVQHMMLNSESYGLLKRVNADSLGLDALDVTNRPVKVRGLEHIDENCYGLISNKRGVAVGFQAPLFMPNGGFSSWEQLSLDGKPLPIAAASYPVPNQNCIKIVVATYVGAAIADVTAIKPLLHEVVTPEGGGNGGGVVA